MLIGNTADITQRKGKHNDTQQVESIIEVEEGEILISQKLHSHAEFNVDINTSSPRLTLQNSFDLLDEEEHSEEELFVAKVAKLVDGCYRDFRVSSH
ncbi:hypothetical protein MTR_7g014600 [Medicago truncatula]|uniref:Uncharacterized protein n=1 Tax=Medicago truncatula TaxID=3880 RepID=G7L681_MEDTR|nr:hypothetical protein MTR_7g014600 [Medicago truncatula]